MTIRPCEASFSFRLPMPAKLADVHEVLTWLFEHHNANPDYLIVSPDAFKELQREIAGDTASFVLLSILNEVTGNNVRVVVSSMMQLGEATFGKLYFENATLYPEQAAHVVESDKVLMIGPEV